MERRQPPGVHPVALVTPPRRVHWLRSGLTPRQERVFNWLARLVVECMVGAWTVSAMQAYGPRAEGAEGAPSPARAVDSSLLDPRARTAPYLSDEFLNPLRGQSGKLRAAFRTPGARLSPPGAAPEAEASAHFQGEGGEYVSDD